MQNIKTGEFKGGTGEEKQPLRSPNPSNPNANDEIENTD